MIKVLDNGYVELIETWGSDESVIAAARMSTNKGFQGWGPIHEPWCQQHPEYHNDTCKPKQGDEKLLRYLWEHKHFSPFEMAGVVVEMQLPIFVAREFIRHRVLSTNEFSARYTELPDLYYIPSLERVMVGGQAKTNKQASGTSIPADVAEHIREVLVSSTSYTRIAYQELLESGLSKELARLVVPVNIYTKWRQSANLRNWLGVLELRLPENVQWETRMYAEAIATIIKQHFPRTYALFAESR